MTLGFGIPKYRYSNTVIHKSEKSFFDLGDDDYLMGTYVE